MICVIRPEDDDHARAVGGWWRFVTNKRNRKIVEVQGRAATRTAVEAGIRGARGIAFFGHGKKKMLRGLEPLLDTDNVQLAANSIVVAVACSSADNLGKKAIRVGVRTYIGFSDKLLSIEDEDERFGAAIAEGVSILLHGGTAAKAHAAMERNLRDLINYYDEAEVYPNGPFALAIAQWDLDCLSARGDLNATVDD